MFRRFEHHGCGPSIATGRQAGGFAGILLALWTFITIGAGASTGWAQQTAFEGALAACNTERTSLRDAIFQRDTLTSEQQLLIDNIQSQRAQLATQNGELSTNLTQCQGHQAGLEAQLEALRSELARKAAALEALDQTSAKQVAALVAENTSLSAQLADLDTQNQSLRQALNASAQELDQIKAERHAFATLNDQLLTRLQGALGTGDAPVPPDTDEDISLEVSRRPPDTVVLEIAPGRTAPNDLARWILFDHTGAQITNGTGARLDLPTQPGVYRIQATIGNFQTDANITVPPTAQKVVEHAVVVELGVLSLELVNAFSPQDAMVMPPSQMVVFQDGQPVVGHVVTDKTRLVLQPGNYTVHIDTQGQLTEMPFSLAAGEHLEMAVQVPVASLDLSFQRANAEPIADGEVRWQIYQANGFDGPPEAQGSSLATQLPLAPGRYTLRFEHNQVQRLRDFEITVGGKQDLSVVLD